MNNAPSKINNEKGSTSGVVQHHEIGELAHFLGMFGKNKDEVVKTLMTSSLQIMGLDEIRQKFADRWKALEKRIDFAVEAFFTKKLKKNDLFLRLDTGSYALIFANTSSDEGLARANKLANELLHLLFGELPEIEKISIKALALDINLADLMDEIQSVEELTEYLQEYNSETSVLVKKEFQEAENDLTICYRPMINHSKKFMSVVEAMPCREDAGKWSEISKNDPLVDGTVELRAELDFKILRETERALNQLGSRRKKPLMMVSVQYETLAHAYRRKKYADILRKLPKYTKRHLIINILGVGKGLLNSRIRQILSALNPMVLGFTFEVSENWDDFNVITDLPVYGVSVGGNNLDDLRWIEPLFAKAKANGIRCCWRNLNDDDLARRAFLVGTNFVSGPVIGSCQLDPISPFSLKRAL